MDYHCQQQSHRIDSDMSLATHHLLTSVIATRPPFSVVLTDWLSMIAALGVGSLPSACRTLGRRASWTRSHVPSSLHARKYHHTVPQGGRSWGMARHVHPLRRTYRMPFTTSRSSTVRGRPPGLAGGSSRPRISHCSSVRSLGYGSCSCTKYNTCSILLTHPLRRPRPALCLGNSQGWSTSSDHLADWPVVYVMRSESLCRLQGTVAGRAGCKPAPTPGGSDRKQSPPHPSLLPPGEKGRNYSHSRRYSTISARMAAVSKWPMSYLESRHASGAPASSYAALTSASIRSSPSCGVSES